jgi:hypothetical protein
VEEQFVSSPASMAGEPGKSAAVCVKPPLSANAPSIGSKRIVPGKEVHVPQPLSMTLLLPVVYVDPYEKHSPPLMLFAIMLLNNVVLAGADK